MEADEAKDAIADDDAEAPCKNAEAEAKSKADGDLALALELSEARTNVARPLLLPREGANCGTALPREALGPPLPHHFAERRGRVQPGDIVSRGALDQFTSSHWQPLIDARGVAGSICG